MDLRFRATTWHRAVKRARAMNALLLALLVFVGGPVHADSEATQRVVLVSVGEARVQLRYSFEGSTGRRVAGLGVRVHYDPTCVRVLRVTDAEKSGLVGLAATPQIDASDADGDPRTTRFVQVAWLDLRGDWLAGEHAERSLLSLDIASLPCAQGSSEMRISAIGSAPGVRLQTTPLTVAGPGSR